MTEPLDNHIRTVHIDGVRYLNMDDLVRELGATSRAALRRRVTDAAPSSHVSRKEDTVFRALQDAGTGLTKLQLATICGHQGIPQSTAFRLIARLIKELRIVDRNGATITPETTYPGQLLFPASLDTSDQGV